MTVYLLIMYYPYPEQEETVVGVYTSKEGVSEAATNLQEKRRSEGKNPTMLRIQAMQTDQEAKSS